MTSQELLSLQAPVTSDQSQISATGVVKMITLEAAHKSKLITVWIFQINVFFWFLKSNKFQGLECFSTCFCDISCLSWNDCCSDHSETCAELTEDCSEAEYGSFNDFHHAINRRIRDIIAIEVNSMNLPDGKSTRVKKRWRNRLISAMNWSSNRLTSYTSRWNVVWKPVMKTSIHTRPLSVRINQLYRSKTKPE